jgi:hypothetical protein
MLVPCEENRDEVLRQEVVLKNAIKNFFKTTLNIMPISSSKMLLKSLTLNKKTTFKV